MTLWEAVKVLDDATEYLQEDAGARDIYWNADLQESTVVLRKLADKLRRKAVKSESL